MLIDYQKQPEEALEINDETMGEIKRKLEKLLTSPNRNGRISAVPPKRTAIGNIPASPDGRAELKERVYMFSTGFISFPSVYFNSDHPT